MPTAARRPLRYATLDDVIPDVDGLLRGHRMVGRWTLGQVCRHLAEALRLTAEGAPSKGPIVRLVGKVIGPPLLLRLFRTERIPEGLRVPFASLAPRSGLDDRAEAEALRATIRLFRAAPGPFPPHPVFGPLSQADWERFHCIHCAHHLSFARPASETAGLERAHPTV